MVEAINPFQKIGLLVLENWGMMLVDEAQSKETLIFSVDEQLYRSSVYIKGVMEGELSIVAPASFLTTLTKNVLGIDETPSEDDCRDAFREMANILGGNFITEAYGADCVFDILNPQVETLQPSGLSKFETSRLHYIFNADGTDVLMSFQPKQNA